MLSFNAAKIIELSKEIGRLAYHFDTEGESNMSEDIRRHNSEQLTLHGEKLEELGLQMCVAQIERTKYAMSDPKGTNNKIASALTELGNRLMDECELFHFISLSSEDSKYYEPKNSLLGQNVDDKIPGVVEDVSEAGKCLGLHRSTAAVFHLIPRLSDQNLCDRRHQLAVWALHGGDQHGTGHGQRALV